MNKVCQRWQMGLKQTLVSSLETPPLGSSFVCCGMKTNPSSPNTHTNMEADNYKLPFLLAFRAQIFRETVSSEPAGVK